MSSVLGRRVKRPRILSAMSATKGPAASGSNTRMAKKSNFRLESPNRKIPCKRTAPRIVCVVETGSRKKVAIKIHTVAPIRTAKMKDESVVFRRIL